MVRDLKARLALAESSQGDSTGEVAKLQGLLASSTQKVETLERQCEELRAHIQSKDAAIEDATRSLKAQERRTQDAETQLAESKRRMPLETAAQVKEVGELKGQLEAASKRNAEMEKIVNDRTVAVSNLESRASQLQGTVTALEQQLKAAKDEIAKLKSASQPQAPAQASAANPTSIVAVRVPGVTSATDFVFDIAVKVRLVPDHN
jgi:chromosome segregation ATPase